MIIIISHHSTSLYNTVYLEGSSSKCQDKEMKCSPFSYNRQVGFVCPTLYIIRKCNIFVFRILRLACIINVKLVGSRQVGGGGRNFIFSSLCLLFCLMKIQSNKEVLSKYAHCRKDKYNNGKCSKIYIIDKTLTDHKYYFYKKSTVLGF